MRQAIFMITLGALLSGCGHKKDLAEKDAQINQLKEQLDHIQSTNSSLLDRLSDMSIITKTGSESIKESLQSINQQYSFIEDLTQKVQQKDSVNLALVMNLKQNLTNIADDDLQVEVRGGKVHVSISDRMLFRSGSSNLGNQAADVLGKIASVLNENDDLQVLVEGHTDNVPIELEGVKDNWDLSVDRATTVVRTLHRDHYLSPERLTAAGRGEYAPKASNETAEGRASNRRTEIIILPQLDQFFKLMESPKLPG